MVIIGFVCHRWPAGGNMAMPHGHTLVTQKEDAADLYFGKGTLFLFGSFVCLLTPI